jgi:hypothetical protein
MMQSYLERQREACLLAEGRCYKKYYRGTFAPQNKPSTPIS